MSLESLTPDDALPPAPATPTAAPPEPVDDGSSESGEAGQPRDGRGRFASPPAAPDSSLAADADPVAAPLDGNAPATPDAPDAQPDDPAALPPAPSGPPAGTPPPASPFTFKHRGQAYTVEGVQVAPEHAPRLQQMLASAREYETVGRQREQQWQRQRATLSAQLEAKDHASTAFLSLMDLPDDQFLHAALELKAQLPEMRYRTEIERRDAELAALRGQAQPQPNAAPDQATQWAQAADQSIAEGFHECLALPAFAGLTRDDFQSALPELRQAAFRFIRPATAQDAMLHGVGEGELLFDNDAFAKTLRVVTGETIQTRQQQQAQQRRQQAAEQAKRQNAAATQKPAAPPTPNSGVASGTGPTGKLTREQWQKRHDDLMSGRISL